MTLDDLGYRICIVGPSNSGKSTLATAIARSRGLTPIHLDQLHHLPNTDWTPRPKQDFIALHDAAILAERWAMDGNYSMCLPQRLARATGIILLDTSTITSLLRYVRRCWFDRGRIGGLEGSSERVKWQMIRHIAVVTPPSRKRYDALVDRTGLPKIKLTTPRDLADFYRMEGLSR